jgi:hypothetical protein
MFLKEKIFVLENDVKSIKLSDDTNKVVCLIFINKDQIIIRGELDCSDTNIEPPIIKMIE